MTTTGKQPDNNTTTLSYSACVGHERLDGTRWITQFEFSGPAVERIQQPSCGIVRVWGRFTESSRTSCTEDGSLQSGLWI